MLIRWALAGVLCLVLWISAARAGEVLDFEGIPQAPGRSLYGVNLAVACRDDAPICRATIGAVLDVLDAVERAHPSARIYCPAVRPVPVEDVRRVVLGWIGRNPDDLKAPGAWVVMVALREAFPCPEKVT